MTKKNNKSALVLSGGGALGMAHIGVVKMLQKKDYKFDFYAGVSAGAIISAALACKKEPDEILEIIKKTNLFRLAFDFTKNKFGIISGDKVKKLLDKIFEEKNFENINYPLYIGATDFATGKRVILNQGKIADAVRASISVPILFKPFYHPTKKCWLVDGGLTQNFPLDIAIKKYKGNKIIGVDVTGNISKQEDFSENKIFGKTKSLKMISQRMIRIIFHTQQNNFPKDDRVLIIRPELNNFTSFDIFKLDQISKQGEKIVNSLKI